MERTGLAVIEQIAPHRRNILHSASNTRSRLAVPVVLYLIAVMLPIGFNLGSVYLNLVRLILLLTIVPLTFQLLRGKFGGVRLPDVFFFLHVFWIIIAITVNNPNRAIEYVGSTVIEFIGSYVLARAYIRTSEDFMALCRALVLMIMLTLPFGLYELYTNHPLILEFLKKIPGVRTEWIVTGRDEVRMGLFRVQGSFPHPIHYGMFASMGFALCFIGLKGVYGNTKRYIASAIMVLCTFMSLSSGALLPVTMQAGLILWATALNFTRYRWLILGILVGIAYIAVDLLSNRSPIMVFMAYSTFSPWNAYFRALIFEYGISNVWAHPWLGIGLSDWVRPSWMPPSVDNFWLVQAMRYGIPGLILLAIGFFQPIWVIARRNFDSDLPLWRQRRAWVFLFIGQALALSTVHIWSTLFSFMFFMFGAGMWLLTASSKQEELSDEAMGLGAAPVATGRSAGPVFTRDPAMLNTRTTSAASEGPQYSRFETSVPPRHQRTEKEKKRL
jgi:hypothetical protein